MSFARHQLLRIIHLVESLKRGEYPNARSFSAKLRQLELDGANLVGVSAKTVQRDIELLRTHYRAPLSYVAESHGYTLDDDSWTFPYGLLVGEGLFAAMFGEQIAQRVVPPPMQTTLSDAMAVQLAAGTPDDIPADLLQAVVVATGAQPAVSSAVFSEVLTAWREARRLRLAYLAPNTPRATQRTVDPHALFLSDGAWYLHAYCQQRKAFRSFAIHRIQEAAVLPGHFLRDSQAVSALSSGNVFDYATAKDILIRCSSDKAGIIGEREWFPEQTQTVLPGGALELRYPECQRCRVIWWVLSYGGHLEVIEPEDLRNEVLQAAQRLVAAHKPRRGGRTGVRFAGAGLPQQRSRTDGKPGSARSAPGAPPPPG